MCDTILIDIPLRDGQVLNIECNPDFLRIVKERTGADDDAAIRKFIHSALSSALEGAIQSHATS